MRRPSQASGCRPFDPEGRMCHPDGDFRARGAAAWTPRAWFGQQSVDLALGVPWATKSVRAAHGSGTRDGKGERAWPNSCCWRWAFRPCRPPS
jgi:hypothetical protein